MSDERQITIERIHASGKQILLALTGGGSGAISALLEVPGASASVIGAIVPYAQRALEHWIRGPVDQACSERTARAMAMNALGIAPSFSDADIHNLRGIGATASLATNRPKRGTHRVHVAWQSVGITAAYTYEFDNQDRGRAEEERIATSFVLHAVADACEIEAAEPLDADVRDRVHRRIERASPEWTELLLGTRMSVAVNATHDERPRAVLFPGAFNPLHAGHQRMAEIAGARTGAPVTFELSIANVDKPPLDFIEIADRLAQFTSHPVLLTRAPTFVEKARIAPGCVFVVGADTIGRISDPNYYHGNIARRDAAIAAIAAEGCRFLVFGRRQEGEFCSLANLTLPPSLRALCDEVPEADFRDDTSSTQVRSE